MPVSHEDVAIGRNGDAGRLVEGVRAIALDSLLAERHQNLARRTHLEDLMAPHQAALILGGQAEHRLVRISVADPHVALGVDGKSVREREHAAAEAGQKFSSRVEFQNRRLRAAHARGGAGGFGVEAPMKDPDVALGIDIGPDQLSPPAAVHVLRNRRPVLDQPVRVRELGLLGILLCVRHRRERHKRGDQCATLWACNHGRPLWGVLNVISNKSGL